MTTLTTPSLHFLVPGIGPAGLPLPIAAQTEPEVAPTDTQRDAAEIEYASWLPAAGAMGSNPWTTHLRHAVR